MQFSRANGFTLIELLIVIAILGILTAIAVPEFMVFQMKSKRVEGVHLLYGVMMAETNCYLENNTYTKNIALLESYDIIPAASSLRFYSMQSIASSNGYLGLGYVAIVMGNINLSDPKQDILAFKQGDPGSDGNGLVDGFNIILDDIFY